MDIYCVGGAVRDSLLGRAGADTDYTVLNCFEAAFIRAFPRARKVGQAHPVFLLHGRQYTLSSALSIDEDLKTRDLTVNALATDAQGYLYAHPMALADLADKILRPVDRDNFFQDPLRVIRAARFSSCLPEFGLAPDLKDLMHLVASRGLLAGVAPERVGHEVRMACQSPRPGRFMRILAQTSSLQPWLAELENIRVRDAARSMDLAAGKESRVWMALMQWVKSKPSSPEPAEDTAEGRMAAELGKRLRLPKEMIAAGRCAAAWSRAAASYLDLEPSLRVKLLLDLSGHNIVEDLLAVIAKHSRTELITQARKDLQAILNVHLPPAWRNLGPRSGAHLHALRCQALRGSR
ncbi:MAG: tRNA nucleotidyltransferase [Desulfovermiculus sp.]